jgi:predicted acetyltransferase
MSSAPAGTGSTRVVRPIVEDERTAYWDVLRTAFHESLSDEDPEVFLAVLGLDRTFAAFEDGELIGTGGAFRFQLTVPGPRTVGAAGLTGISVKPTARRRGVLSSMLRSHLDALHEAGDEPVAILQASEPQIYGRFGYGLASIGYKLAVPRSAQALRPVAGIDKFRMRLVDPDAGYDATAAIYAEAAAARPGMLARDGLWKRQVLLDTDHARQGFGPMLWVVAEAADGEPAGFAVYRTKAGGTSSRPGGKVRVRDVYGRDLAAYAAVWRYLLDLDLTDEVLTFGRPVDDPILHLLANARAAQPEVRDQVYARLVDVDTALAARRYAAPVDVVFEVSDPFCPWNTGRYRLSADAEGAVCARTSDPADLLLDQRELGAAYLGGTGLGSLGRAGLVEELTPGALAAASRAFLSDPPPWLPFGF